MLAVVFIVALTIATACAISAGCIIAFASGRAHKDFARRKRQGSLVDNSLDFDFPDDGNDLAPSNQAPS